MLIKKSGEIPYSEVTPKSVYLNRRDFMKAAGGVGVVLAAGRAVAGPDSALAGTKLQYTKSDLSTQGETLTPLKDITTYNNFYEFGTEKEDPHQNAKDFRTHPWKISIEGHDQESDVLRCREHHQDASRRSRSESIVFVALKPGRW